MRDFAPVLPTAPFETDRLLAPAQAVAAYLSATGLAPSGTETIALDDAAGRVLAEDAVARESHPAADRSTMDGFAVATAGGTAPRRIAGEIRMGAAPPAALAPGEAMRIPTGGGVPDGADAVVPIEDARETDGWVVPLEAPERGAFITPAASDLAAGTVALGHGRRLGAPELGVLATLGYARVPVYRRPLVGVLSTGDELIDPGAPLAAGRIRDSNRYALAAALRAMGAEAVHLPRAADTPEALHAALAAALERCDAVLTSGGSSVGARDLVPQIVRGLGRPGVVVHGLRVKPGKPTMLGAIGRRAVIGLPGNPTSSLAILEAVVRPAIAALTGERGARPVVLEARAAAAFAGRAGWTHVVPATLVLRAGVLEAEPIAIHSAHTSLLARASGYVVLSETRSRIEAGAAVPVTLFSCGGAPIAFAS